MGEPWKEGKTRFEGNKVIISMISYPYFASFYHFCLCNARSRKLHEQVSNDIADCNNATNSLHYIIFLSFWSFSYMLQLCSAVYLWRHTYSKKVQCRWKVHILWVGLVLSSRSLHIFTETGLFRNSKWNSNRLLGNGMFESMCKRRKPNELE